MTTQIQLQEETYKLQCEEMREILRQEKELAERKKQLRQELELRSGIQYAGDKRLQYGICVRYKEVTGSVDYKAMAEKLAGDEFEELSTQYRKPSRVQLDVRSY